MAEWRGEPVGAALGWCYPLPMGLSDASSATHAIDTLQFRVLIENVSSGVALVDASGRFALYNRRFLEMFGLSPDSDVRNVNDQDWSLWKVYDETGQLLHFDDHPVRKASLTRQPVRSQLVGVRLPAGGETIWMLISAAPLLDKDGAIEHLICTYHDVTAQKKTEERLREADQRKTEFLAVLSHELRNPLSPIRNSLAILDRVEPGCEQARKAQEVIGRQIGHMTRLIEELLDVTRISRGKVRLHRERLDLNQMAQRALEDHQSLFDESGIRVVLRAAPSQVWVNGDRTRVAQVIGNLLFNAAKFTPAGGLVTLTIESSGEVGSIRVEDTGAGMAPELLGKLFNPFVQAERTLDRSRGGLGLGLVLVKGLVELHGGSVRAHSDGPGMGSAFTIQLPIDDTPSRQPEPAAPYRTPSSPLRVLIIEDHVDSAESLRDVLEMDGHVVDLAFTGSDGLAAARAGKPDVVLCDIGLPEMDGFEVAEAIRRDPEISSCFLIALSGYASPEDVTRALEAGFDRHLAKPAELDAIESAIAGARRG